MNENSVSKGHIIPLLKYPLNDKIIGMRNRLEVSRD